MKHDSHPHELYVATMLSENPKIPCFSCKLPTFGICYACTKCKFYLHKFCFELPKSANFRSHPKHTLDLVFQPKTKTQATCDACNDSCNGFTYNCSSCDFNLHSNCAVLMNSRSKDDHEEYVAAFLKRKLVEMKSLRSELGSSNTELESLKQKLGSSNGELESMRSEMGSLKKEMGSLVDKLGSMSVQMMKNREEEERKRLEDMEYALERKKHQIYMDQLNRIDESITRLGAIGTSSSYEYTYRYY